ncbi:MAG: GTP-binding protein [Candidatus Lokiarchaeota archaeon]|nr:GTP-binding protein [Candidatus Lokiarchaeota archaeon]
MMYEKTFKIIVFGDAGTGKTTLTHRFLTNLYIPDAASTIGVEFQIKAVEVADQRVKLQIWDFAGEERFRFLLPSYVKGASGGIFMYDITNYASLAHIDEWFEIINKNKSVEKFPIIVVGGKSDLTHFKEVSTKKAMKLAKEKQANGFVECSSKTGENVQKIFNMLNKLIIENALWAK